MRKRFFVLLILIIGFLLFGCSDPTSENSVANYKVTYHANNGTDGSVPIDSENYSNNQTVTVKENSGNLVGDLIAGDHSGSGIKQRLIGWNTDPAETAALYKEGDNFQITEDINLYAIYSSGNDVLGKVGQAGGWVFYDAGSTQFWGRYIEAWRYDEGSYQWKVSRTNTTGTSPDIGLGSNNTTAHLTGTAHPAAEATRNASHNTKTDWFLPSQNELELMYTNLKDHGIGRFSDEMYWCSYEESRNIANCQYFSNGNKSAYDKMGFLCVRAARYF